MATGVINSPDKDSAIKSAAQFLRYYPYRYAAIVEFKNGSWGWCSGKTKSRMNRLAHEGYSVWLVANGRTK